MNRLIIIQIIVFLLVIGLTSFVYSYTPKENCQKFAEQSYSFLQGRIDINQGIDTAYHDGKYYWPQGPFPSLVLMPFQLIFGLEFDQTLMQPLLIILLIYCLYKLALVIKFAKNSALILVFAFIFASPVIRIVAEPCYSNFAHIITMLLLTLLLLEFQTKKRWFLLGFLIGAILATRPSASFIFIVLIYSLYKTKLTISEKFNNITYFVFPIIMTVLLLIVFNQMRFGDPFNNGYGTNDVGEYLSYLRQDGVFNISYIPRNFYAYFLMLPEPVVDYNSFIAPYITYNAVGLSFFIIAPFFLYSLKSLLFKNTTIKLYWLTILVTLVLLLSYYATGWDQLGPRFASDFMPLLFLLLLASLNPPHLSETQKSIIYISSLFNAYLLIGRFIVLFIK